MNKKQKRTLVRILLSLALFVIALLLPLEGYARLAAMLAPYLVIGYDVLWKAARSLFRGQMLDENFLMALATVGALCIGELPEAVAVMLFYQVGELFQSYAVGKSRASIAELMDIRPDYANLWRDGEMVKVDPEEVKVGETIAVKAGEKVPLDGVILEGRTTINTAALTGESLPRDAGEGDEVLGGCVNLTGLIRVRVTKPFEQSTVSRILEMVENASAKKARAENFITRFARVYTPAVVAAAALLAVLPPLLFHGAWSDWVLRALTFLVISCPCALVISVPLSFFGGIGGASRKGILIKGANYMETLSKCGAVVFDKTGTLTEGAFRVTAVHPDKIDEVGLLRLAAAAESYSDHPISLSLKAAYRGRIEREEVSGVREIAGQGVQVEFEGNTLSVGNDKLMAGLGIEARRCHKVGTVVHVALGKEYMGHIVISDVVKEGAKDAIQALRRAGVTRTVMLTGDREEVARQVAGELGLDEYRAELLPGDKVEAVEALMGERGGRGSLAFVGDGINDAPVLTRADVGIAMGALGSDAAIEAADIVLMDDNPAKIAEAIRVSKKTLSIVRQNIVFALGVKALVLALGAAGMANMWLAVFADVGVSVIAILNAMRALRG
jgi:Cd2+/Zn2+-exporting ATPase